MNMHVLFFCCCFYKDREYFITGGGDGEVKVWNAVVFTQVHVFYGHHDVITGLQTHKTEPLLFSSSLDGSVQIWRMDNFSKFMRLDLAEKVYSMKLVVDEEFYCQTENEIRIYSLNQFYNLFAPVESSVYKLELCPAVKGHPSRIIASTEVLSSFAYSREKNRLHCVLQTGQVLTFNCDTNPCRAVEVWTADTVDEKVLQIVQLTLGYEKNGFRVTDTVILGGLRNGQISLLDASECVLIKNLQAHEGNITCMEKATDIGETGFKLLETSQKMATGGADRFIKIWALSVNCGKLYHNIVIELLLKIPCSFTPEYISMYENTISVSSSDRSDKGKLHMFRMDCQESKEYQYSTLQHPQDEDHAEHITALDKCPLLGLFATASEDGFIKIWNRHNQLIREMGFGEPMHGLCFANIRGDILFGFQNHICTIPLTSYFPRNYLERITRQEFKDEYRETPIAYNHRIRPWFDLKALPQYSISVAKRIVEKKPVEEEDILEDLEATPRSPALEPEDRPDQEDSDDDYTELPAVTIESPSTEGITDKTVKAVKSRIRKQHQGEDTDNKQGEFVERVLSAPSSDHRRRLKLERMKEERRKSDAQYLEKLSPWERDLFKKHPIIAPDGYIPNSVARKRLGFRPPPTPPKKTKDTWTIESIRLPVTPKPVYKKPTEEEDERWEEVKARYLQFLDDASSEEEQASSSSDDSEVETKNTRPPRNRGAGRPRNDGVGRGKKKVRVVDSDDDDMEFDDSEAVDDTDIFPPGFEKEIGQGLVGGPMSLLRPGSDLKEFRSFNWGDFDKAEEGRQSTSSYSPWKRVQTMVRATSTLSNQSTTSSKRGLTRSRRSTPTTPIYELKSKKFEFHRVDLDLGTPERMKRSVGTMSREKSKSFRLTNMVVDEQSTNVTFKEGSKSGHRKGILPAVDMDIIRRLLAEDFCLDLQGTASFDSIMQHLIKLLDTDNQALHAKICDYIIAIHREIGIQDHYLERIISKLSTQIGGDNSALKLTGIRTLKEIGINRQDVLASILPRLLDTMDDIREEAREALAFLSGVENKDELLDLMNSLGMMRQFDNKEDEEEALKALAMRLDVPFRSDSFADWINNWVDDSSSIYDSEPEVKLDDIEKAWDGRQHKWKQESLCMTEAASRASTRLKELSFQSKGSPLRGLSGLSGTLSGFDDYGSDFSHSDGESLQGELIHSSMTNDQQTKSPKCSDNHLEGDILQDAVQDYDPDYTNKLLMEDLLKDFSDIHKSDFEHGSENDLKMPEKNGRPKSFEQTCNDVILERIILDRYESRDDISDSAEVNMESKDKNEPIGNIVDQKTKNKKESIRVIGSDNAQPGSPIQETEEYVPDKLQIEDLDRVKTEGQLSDRSSRSGRRSVKNAQSLPGQGFLTRDEPILYKKSVLDERANLQQKEETSYSTEEEDWFDPRDPSLYRYYKDRYNKEKETDGKFSYRNMSKQFSKSHIGGGEDVDSQIGSLDSQMGDALSTNDSGIMSMQDSGIGRDMSDTYSYKSGKASGMLSKEKIHSKAGSYTSRIDSHRKHNLSPVKSSSTLGGLSAKSSPRAKDPDWMKFFQTPTALERKRMVMVKKEFSEGKVKPGNAAVINYISDGLPMLPGEAGLRLLKSVRVASDKSLPPCTEKHHRIESIPGKLSVHTKHENKGQSKYGILQMQWTTTVPAPISHDTYNGRYSSVSDATSTLGGSSVSSFPSKRVLPAIVEKYGNSDRNETSAFEDDEPDYHHLSGGFTPDYEWDYPIPPPPAKESRISVPYIKKEHENYCKYYNLLKKKGGILKKSQSKLLLPTVEIKKVLPERLKLPKDVTKLSRLSSILFPSLTLNQLLSARS